MTEQTTTKTAISTIKIKKRNIIPKKLNINIKVDGDLFKLKDHNTKMAGK